MVENMTPADVKAVLGNEDGCFGNGSWWIILLFIILFGGNGFWGNNGNRDYATTGDLERNFYQQALTTKLDQLGSDMNGGFFAINDGVKDSKYEIANRVTDATYAINTAIANLAAQNDHCCCENKTLQLENKYDITNTIHNEGEATRALLQANKIESLQEKIQELELQAAMAGVVKYPSGTTYTAGFNPYLTNGYGYGYGYGTNF